MPPGSVPPPVCIVPHASPWSILARPLAVPPRSRPAPLPSRLDLAPGPAGTNLCNNTPIADWGWGPHSGPHTEIVPGSNYNGVRSFICSQGDGYHCNTGHMFLTVQTVGCPEQPPSPPPGETSGAVRGTVDARGCRTGPSVSAAGSRH